MARGPACLEFGSSDLKRITSSELMCCGCVRSRRCDRWHRRRPPRNRPEDRWQCHCVPTSLTDDADSPDRRIRATGVEPATSCSQSTRSTKLSYALHSRQPRLPADTAYYSAFRNVTADWVGDFSGIWTNARILGLSPLRTTLDRSTIIRYRPRKLGTSGSFSPSPMVSVSL